MCFIFSAYTCTYTYIVLQCFCIRMYITMYTQYVAVYLIHQCMCNISPKVHTLSFLLSCHSERVAIEYLVITILLSVQFVPGLPKTRSGKIMRRILRKIAENQPDQLGDISTLADSSIVDQINRIHVQKYSL